ncbi:MAG: hypothetical protein ACOX69_08030 [Coriobacteriales bacterium]|jgi:exopolyphosphatase/guanosine-5'-triphosphate,3'-diphosphate pyrophosphatase
MTLALIDMGSNTIRLSVYAIGQEARTLRSDDYAEKIDDLGDFARLITKKVNAGLAEYVDDDNCLSEDGIETATNALRYLLRIVDNLAIDETRIFATASLRNVDNCKEARAAIEQAIGHPIEILSSEEEALLGFSSFKLDCPMSEGVMCDIGGGSTEVVVFKDNEPVCLESMPIGSLKLFKRKVKGIKPTASERKAIRKQTDSELDKLGFKDPKPCKMLCGIGGTSRAVLKLVNAAKKRSPLEREFTAKECGKLLDFLCSGDSGARELILRTAPDRIHTIVPGLIVLYAIVERFGVHRLHISRYGVREGYVSHRILGR